MEEYLQCLAVLYDVLLHTTNIGVIQIHNVYIADTYKATTQTIQHVHFM
jgi:hypothetical protein